MQSVTTLEAVEPILFEVDNEMLVSKITMKELRVAIFGLAGDKAPSLDGFQDFFYHKLWHVFNKELLGVVEESRW